MQTDEEKLTTKIRDAGDWCTFHDVERFLTELGVPVYGNLCVWTLANTVYWANLSPEAVDLLLNMFNAGKIFFYSVEKEAYDRAGGGIGLPLAKSLAPSDGYKRKHWQPVMVSTSSRLTPEDHMRKQIDHIKKYMER